MPAELNSVWFWAFGLALAVMAFFLRRTVSQLDSIDQRSQNFALRSELTTLRADVFAAIEGVRNNEIRTLHEMMREDSKALRDEMRSDIAGVRTDINALANGIRAEIRNAAKR